MYLNIKIIVEKIRPLFTINTDNNQDWNLLSVHSQPRDHSRVT